MSGTGPARAASNLSDRLPLIALLSALVVGPLGMALGAWSLIGSRRRGRPLPQLAIAAVALGAVQTVVLVSWAVTAFPGLRPSSGPTPVTSSAAWTYPTTPPPSGPVSPPPPTTPGPLPTSIDQVTPPKVDTYRADQFTPDQTPVDQGAVAAKTGSYTGPQATIKVKLSQWKTATEAAQHAERTGSAEYGASSLRASGTIAQGKYWYYELKGQGTVYWNEGTISASFTGKPLEVQEFFLSFPK